MSGPAAPPIPAELELLLRRMRLPYLRHAEPDVLATACALADGRHSECLEEQDEGEEVVDAQCLLEEVGGEVLLASARTLPQRETSPNPIPAPAQGGAGQYP